MAKTTTKDMTQGSIWRHLLWFALPLLFGNLFQQMYNAVDSVVVGNFVGGVALGGVTTVTPAINTLVGFFMGLSTGASVIISQYFGAHDVPNLRKAVHTSLVGTFLLSLVFMVLGWNITPFLLEFMRTDATIVPYSTTYLRIYFLGITGLMIYNMGSAILRAVGDSKRPLYFLIFTSVLNVILDLFFVLKLRMAVAGVAYATILSQFISAFLVLVVLFRSQEVYRLSWAEMRLNLTILKKIINVGFPAGFQMALTAFSNVFVQSYINSFGADSTAGWGAYFRIDMFIIMPMQSIALAITTFTGQNAGAGNLERIRKGVSVSIRMAVLATALLCIPEFIIAPNVIRLFNQDPGVVAYGTLFIRVNCLFDIFACMNQIHAGMLRGVGDARAPMYIMLFSFVVFRQLYLLIITHITDSIIAVSFGYPIGWLMCTTLLRLYYSYSGWERRVKKPEPHHAALAHE